MQNICYNSVMNWVRRQLMRPSATAMPAGAAPHRCAANSLCVSAALRDENSSRTSRTLREIKTTTYLWDGWFGIGGVNAFVGGGAFMADLKVKRRKGCYR